LRGERGELRVEREEQAAARNKNAVAKIKR
jgi:hypothetical protein